MSLIAAQTSKNVLDKIRWTARAVSDDETRYFMTGILVEENPEENNVRLVATDGRRLHSTTIAKGILEPGIWKVIDQKSVILFQEILGQFPNWRRVVPTSTETIGEVSFEPYKKNDCGPLSQALGHVVLKIGRPINIGYIIDLAPEKKSTLALPYALCVANEPNGTNTIRATVFNAVDRYAVIMPMLNPGE